MKKYNILFLSNSVSHEGRLQVYLEANSDTHVDDSELDVR